MTTSRDPERELRSYFEDRGTNLAPDGLLDAALARVDRTRQQPGWLVLDRWASPWTQTQARMVGHRLAFAALLLAVVVALVGAALLVGALLRRPAFPANGAIDLAVNDRLLEIGPDGDVHAIPLAGGAGIDPVWSHDGSHLAAWVYPPSTAPGPSMAAQPYLTVLEPDGTAIAKVTSGQLALGGPVVAMDTGTISWSADGTALIFDGAARGLSHLYRFDLATGLITDITPRGVQAHWPAWSPDGRLIAFVSPQSGQDDRLWVMNADGSDAHQVGVPLPSAVGAGSGLWPPQWSADSRRVAFDAIAGNTDKSYALFVVELGTGRQIQVGPALRDTLEPIWGPDPSELAFEDQNGTVPGKVDVYVGDPATGSVRLVAGNADLWGWSPDGSSLLIGSPSCWNDNHSGESLPSLCHEGIFTVSLDGKTRREIVPATTLDALAPIDASTVTIGITGAGWRPVVPGR